MIFNIFFHKILLLFTQLPLRRPTSYQLQASLHWFGFVFPIYISKYFLRFATANCDRPTGCRWRASSPRLGLVFHRPCPSDFGGKLRPDAGLQLSASSHCTGLVFAFYHFWFRSTYKYTPPNQKLKKDLSFFLWQTAVGRRLSLQASLHAPHLVLYKSFFVKKLLLQEV